MANEDRRERGQAAADHVGRDDDDPIGADAGIARRLLVLADREEVAAEDRAVQDHRHHQRRRRQAIKVCGMPRGAADGQPFEPRETLAEGEAGGGVLGVPAGDAAVDQQAAQRDDERLHPQLGDQQPVHAPIHADADRQRQGQPQGTPD